MPVILRNNAFSTLATAITASDTAIVVADGSKFPALSAGEYFYATLVSSAGTTEIVRVTARASNSLTAVRAQDGSSAASFQIGALVEMRANAAAIRELRDEASEVGIADAGGYYTATDVEGALQELRAPTVDNFTGDGVTFVYTLSSALGFGGLTDIHIDGVYQYKNTYTVSGATLTFSEAPPLNAAIEVVVR
jgi:hypothetical protein